MENIKSFDTKEEKKKILIIEDDQTIGNMYKIGLSREGYEIIVAKDGEQGVMLALEIKPDLILLDIIMPKMDGFEVLENLKKREATRDILVVMLTNLGQEEDREKGNSLGAIDYIVKAQLTPMQVSEKIIKYLN